jgi:NADPH:quinone reductase-like Zn-dependent oxidoreductase
VAAAGPGVTSFSVGDRVFGQAVEAYATLSVVRADELAALPERIDLAEAAALPTVTTTGAQLPDLALENLKGATVLVLEAIGNVGRSAVYRLKERSATVIAGVLSRQAVEAQRTRADRVVALDDDRDIASLPALDAIADTIDGPTAATVLGKLKPGGVFASVLGPPSNTTARPDVIIKTMQVKPDQLMLVHMARAEQSGKLSIPIGKSFPLKDAPTAHAAAESGSVAGKILLFAE